MTTDELRQEAEEWLRSTDNHLNEEKTHFLSESEYAERAYLAGAEPREKRIAELEKENAELKSIADFQTSSNMDRYFQLKRGKEQLTKAKDHIKKLLDCLKQDTNDPQTNYYVCQYMDKAEQFLSEVEK